MGWLMNKLAIPAILVATVMVAGMFAFIPVEQASTVHLSGTVIAVIGPGGIGVGDFATDSITADALAPDALTEISNTINTADINIGSVDVGGLPVGVFATAAITGDALAPDASTEINNASFGSDVISFFSTDLSAETANNIIAASTSDFVTCITVDNPTGVDAEMTVSVGANAITIEVYNDHTVNAGCFGSVGGVDVTYTSTAALDVHATLIAEEDANSSLG